MRSTRRKALPMPLVVGLSLIFLGMVAFIFWRTAMKDSYDLAMAPMHELTPEQLKEDHPCLYFIASVTGMLSLADEPITSEEDANSRKGRAISHFRSVLGLVLLISMFAVIDGIMCIFMK